MNRAEREMARKIAQPSATEVRAFAEAGILPLVQGEYWFLTQALDALDERDKLLAECSYELRLFHCVELADRIDALLKGTP